LIRQNAGASLLDIGDGVACLEFHSKMNTIGGDIISALFESLEEVNAHFAVLSSPTKAAISRPEQT